jgi:hypothetical protein
LKQLPENEKWLKWLRCFLPQSTMNMKIPSKIAIILSVAHLCIAAQVKAAPDIEGDSEPINAQPSQCLADVKEVTAWDETATRQAANQVCTERRRHIRAKQRFETSLVALNREYRERTNHGFSAFLPEAIRRSRAIVENCIALKEGFTAPHNVAALLIPETIRIDCYVVGTQLVEAELSSPSKP